MSRDVCWCGIYTYGNPGSGCQDCGRCWDHCECEHDEVGDMECSDCGATLYFVAPDDVRCPNCDERPAIDEHVRRWQCDRCGNAVITSQPDECPICRGSRRACSCDLQCPFCALGVALVDRGGRVGVLKQVAW